MYGFIYRAANMFNNKMYIGKTTGNLQRRKSEYSRREKIKKNNFNRKINIDIEKKRGSR